MTKECKPTKKMFVLRINGITSSRIILLPTVKFNRHFSHSNTVLRLQSSLFFHPYYWMDPNIQNRGAKTLFFLVFTLKIVQQWLVIWYVSVSCHTIIHRPVFCSFFCCFETVLYLNTSLIVSLMMVSFALICELKTYFCFYWVVCTYTKEDNIGFQYSWTL